MFWACTFKSVPIHYYSFQLRVGLSYTPIKTIQSAIRKCITWPKKLGKGTQTWDKVYIDYRLMKKIIKHTIR
jgi:hypothetical protein